MVTSDAPTFTFLLLFSHLKVILCLGFQFKSLLEQVKGWPTRLKTVL